MSWEAYGLLNHVTVELGRSVGRSVFVFVTFLMINFMFKQLV